MNLHIREEGLQDHKAIDHLIYQAFKDVPESDNSEHVLVRRLRKSMAFIPDLALVAISNDLVVGHILLTEIHLVSEENAIPALALAPVSVLPQFQKKGIGSSLIKKAHERAKYLGFPLIALVGHKDYYPKFGYELASKYNIQFPFDVPDENCMVLLLDPDDEKYRNRTISYPREFYTEE